MADPVSVSDASMAQAVVWHRQVAAMVEAADRAGVAASGIPGLRARLAIQATVLNRAASRFGGSLPPLVPTPAEIAAAGSNLGDLSTPAVARAARTMETTLAAVDEVLGVSVRELPEGQARTGATFPPPPPSAVGPGAVAGAAPQPSTSNIDAPAGFAQRSVFLRNAGVYGAYAAAVLAVQAVLFALLDEARGLPTAAPFCLLALPALAWLAGFVTIGALFRAAPGESLNRTPRLGAVVCLVPNALLCGAVGILFVAN